MKIKVLLFSLLITGTSLSAQNLLLKQLKGRVYTQAGDVAAVHVMNTSSGKASITNENGFFTITVKSNDTLVFSAVQFKRKVMVVTPGIMDSKMLYVPLQDALTELDEVIVMPYNLTGDMRRDLERMKVDSVVTASTLGLPNAHVKPPTQAERKLFEATTGGGIIPLNPVLNAISGRTKMLKNRIARNEKYGRTQRVRAFYTDTLYQTELKIPKDRIPDFMYFCEIDSSFQAIVDTHNWLWIWEFMKEKSSVYRKNNDLD